MPLKDYYRLCFIVVNREGVMWVWWYANWLCQNGSKEASLKSLFNRGWSNTLSVNSNVLRIACVSTSSILIVSWDHVTFCMQSAMSYSDHFGDPSQAEPVKRKRAISVQSTHSHQLFPGVRRGTSRQSSVSKSYKRELIAYSSVLHVPFYTLLCEPPSTSIIPFTGILSSHLEQACFWTCS